MKNKLKIIYIMLLALLIFSTACKASSIAPESPSFDRGGAPPNSPAPQAPGGGNAEKGGAPGVSDQRMIVRTADVALVVQNVTEARDKIAALAENLTGFVVSSSVRGEGQGQYGSISIRVPDDQFDAARAALRNLAVRVDSDSTNAQDVTEQYSDLQARLKNAQATEAQYVQILSRANTVEDTLKVYNALSQVRQQIEQLQGQIQYLERTTSMSLISVSLRPQGTTAQLVAPGWSPLEVLKSAVRAIISFGKVIVNVLIWLAIFSPVWGMIFVIRWLVRKAKKNRAAARTGQNTVK